MNATVENEAPNRWIAFASSMGFHALLFLLLLLLRIIPPDPPFEEGGGKGMEMGVADIGYDLEGLGETESMEESSAASSATPPPQGSDDQLLAEDDGEAMDRPEPSENPRTESPVVTPPTKKPPKINEPTVDRRLSDALNNWNKPGEPKPGQGKTPGDPGDPTGIPGGGGLTAGDGWSLRPGSGGGGVGRGLSRGPDLSERPVLQNPTWVEVKVVVDRAGNVIRTTIADSGTPDVAIQNVALRAAKTCRFVALPNGPQEQAHFIKLRFLPS